ncbi:MAG TPA: glycosyltransferase [Candidatus Acidoferrales bacterium]|nr:glycosyltransferase [Candidatus Acidoferrales bacterium]
MALRATIQLCTYNRAALLERVLEGCFEQTVPGNAYEVVVVNDGSPDDTRTVTDRARERATCAFTVIEQRNTGLARARNAGIACSRGERIIFIDDDVLPTPAFVEEHLRTHDAVPAAIVRGAVINTASFDVLPPPVWSLKNYSGNYFWTSNVSLPRLTLERAGGFTETFTEYGWEDIELGLRLRALGVPSRFNARAVAFHYKPPPKATSLEGMLRQARAQARTAVQLGALHPHWRVTLATGDHRILRAAANAAHAAGLGRIAARAVNVNATELPLNGRERIAASIVASLAYYEELERAHREGVERVPRAGA